MPRGRARIERHGANHSPGGSDPIPHLKEVVAFWSGQLSATGAGQTVIVPSAAGGAALAFTIEKIVARVESPDGSHSVHFRVEKSPGGGAFSATTVGDVTVAAGAYEATTTGLSVAVVSGNLLRVNLITIGPTSTYHVQVLGAE